MPGRAAKKQSQRTKGNVRPSSSSQAAQLLSESGTSTQGFIGFGAFTGEPCYVPAADLDNSGDATLDADLRLVLRKLSKKDSITKIKALQEFNALIKEKDSKDVKAVLPYWPRIYSKIALDVDHRVREAAQQSMTVLAVCLHRQLAPHLKKLMAYWLLGMCDPYPTVASAAQNAFNTAFSVAKQAQALSFCQKGVLEYTVDNLLNQRADTLSDPKLTSPEDMTSKYNRVVSSSLLATRKLLKALANDLESVSQEKISNLLESPKFWKLAKSPVNSVRSSTYLFLATVCQILPQIAYEHLKKLSSCILLNVDECDIVVSGSVWEAVLSLVNMSSECWEYVSIQKAVWPKLRTMLTEGCRGNASVIGPSILPLLSKLPKHFAGQPLQFYDQFFSSMKVGISKDSVQMSPIECSAMVTALVECVHYMVKVDISKCDQKACHHVFMDQLVPILLVSLTEERATLARGPVYSLLGSLLKSLAELGPTDQESSTNQSLAQNCWTIVTNLSLECLTPLSLNDQSVVAPKRSHRSLANRLISLAESLLYPQKFQSQTGKTTSVKFSDHANSPSPPAATNSGRDSSKLNHFQKQYISELILKSFTMVNSKLEGSNVHLFVNFFKLYPSEEVVSQLLGAKAEDQQQAVFESFIADVLLGWLLQMQDQFEPKQLQEGGANVLSAIFTLFSFLDKNQIATFLDNLCQNLTKPCMLKILLTELTASRREIAAVCNWLEKPTLGEKLVSLTSDVCSSALRPHTATQLSEAEDNWATLTMALSSSSHSEPLLKMEYIEKILCTIHSTLKELSSSKDRHRVDLSVQFVAKVLANFFPGLQDCSLIGSAEDLILIMFMFALDSDLNISDLTRTEVRSVCTTGMQTLYRRQSSSLKESSFFLRVFRTIKNVITSKVTTEQQLQNVFEEVKILLEMLSAELKDGLANSHLTALLGEIFTIPEHVMPPQQFEECLMITGQLTAMCWDVGRNGTNDDSTSGDFPTSMLFVTLLQARLLKFLQDCSDDTEQTANGCSISWINDDVKLLSVIYNLLCSVAICQRWLDTDPPISKKETIQKSVLELHSQLATQLGRLTSEQTDTLLDLFLERLLADGHWQAMGLNCLLTQVFPEGLTENRIGVHFEEELTEKRVQMLRVILGHCTESTTWEITQVLITKLVSLPKDSLLCVNGALGLLPLINMATEKWTFHEDPAKQAEFLELLDTMIEWRNEDIFLFYTDVMLATPQLVLLNIEAMHYLQLIWSLISALNDNQSDFIMCSVASWIQSVNESKNLISSVQAQVFTVNACKLLSAVANSLQQPVPDMPENIVTEWNEFFSEAAYSLLLPIYVNTAENVMNSSVRGTQQHIVAWLGEAVTLCPKTQLLNVSLEVTSSESSPTEMLNALLHHFCPMLLSEVYAIQISAYHVLSKIVSELHSLETVKTTEMECVKKLEKLSLSDDGISSGVQKTTITQYYTEFEDDDETNRRQPNKMLMETLIKAWKGVETHLDPSDVSSDRQLAPSYCTLGYLLTWNLQLQFLKTASSELRAEYLRYLDILGLIDVFLSDIFCLIPETLVSAYQARKDELANATSAFMKNLLCTSAPSSDKLLQNVACMLYEEALQTIPAVIRTWWLKQNRAFASFIDNFTKLFISPVLCRKEIRNTLTIEMDLENIVIRARPTSREIVAVYTLDDVSIEMIIALPENYPLGTISVRSDQRRGISPAISKKWLLQLNLFLQHQNGSIMDGLRLWKHYIDKKFEGVEECTICCCVVHGTDFQLPRKQCKTCHKKFHSICLYKWFTESQNSSCPLCRTLF